MMTFIACFYLVVFKVALNSSGLGNEILYRLVTNRKYRLRVIIKDWNEEILHADYSTFSIASSSDFYRLSVSGYNGTAGNLSYTIL